MKRSLCLFSLMASITVVSAQTFQFTLKVQDETGNALKGVSIENFHVRTADDGMAILSLPEGRTTLRLHLNGFVDQTVDVITSRIVRDNYITLVLRRIPGETKKIIVYGTVTTFSDSNRKVPVPHAQVKLFYSGQQQATQSGVDGSFKFQVPEVSITNYEWVIHFYHPGFLYSEPYHFTVPKTNQIQLNSTLVPNTQQDTSQVHYAYYVINPIPWKGDDWDVLDLSTCSCLTRNDKGFKVKITSALNSVHVKLLRKEYEDVEVFMTRDELLQNKSGEYIDMMKRKSFSITRVHANFSWTYSLFNSSLFTSPNNQTFAVMWHPASYKWKNKIALVAGVSRVQTIETTNQYKTLNGFENEIKSRYHVTNIGTIGVRYYFNDFMLRTPTVFGQGQCSFVRQTPVEYFNQEGFSAERMSYQYFIPSLLFGARKNLLPYMALEGSMLFSYSTVKSQSFIFNYFGSAYTTEDKNRLVNVGLNVSFVFYLPAK